MVAEIETETHSPPPHIQTVGDPQPDVTPADSDTDSEYQPIEEAEPGTQVVEVEVDLHQEPDTRTPMPDYVNGADKLQYETLDENTRERKLYTKLKRAK